MAGAVNQKVWDEIEEEKKKPQPTPPIGLAIVFHGGGDKSKPVPARVFRYEDEPGRIAVTVETPTGLQFKGGVYYHGSRHNNGSNRTIYNNGTWDYIEGETAPKWHFKQHTEYIERRQKAQQNAETMQAATEAAMKAKREAQTAGV
jgi:hypothetical protein